MEKMINNRLTWHIEKHKLIADSEKNKSTQDHLIVLGTELQNKFSNNHYTIAVFLDLTKAFDTIARSGILQYLQNTTFRINDKLYKSYP